ncbi:MAG: hypothetical protein HY517_03695 [Candidatus Aenigmarchaeota archaeon]|nr:hypothetical protein [Candidatus Aenigmarchaeota archaeon]
MPQNEHMKSLEKRVGILENEIMQIKFSIKNPEKPVSLRGIAKLKVSKKELDKEIEKAKKSLRSSQ